MQSARIANARDSDRHAICRVHKASITILSGTHYTPEEIEAWVGPIRPDDYLEAIRGDIVLVAWVQSRIVGFVQLRKRDGSLHSLYVHPRHVRGGVGKTLLVCIESEARKLGHRQIVLHATLNSVPFFVERGYSFQREEPIPGHAGATLPCMQMHKTL